MCESMELSIYDEQSLDKSQVTEGEGVEVDARQDLQWNIEELYGEILYEIHHHIGCSQDHEGNKRALCDYIQEAFKIDTRRHEELIRAFENSEGPKVRLNIECIEGKDFKTKHSDIANPFVAMYLESSPTHIHNTSVKYKTLDPKWEEHFSLPISKNLNKENLVLEVWNVSESENVKEQKVKVVKALKGLKRYLKEIAVTSGKSGNKLIGKATLPLTSIPTAGLCLWLNLDKNSHTKIRGMLKVRLGLSSAKNKNVAANEHRLLLKILLLHELESSQVAPYWWSKFGTLADAIVTQHAAQCGLSKNQIALTEYCVFSAIHVRHPLSYRLFEMLVGVVVKAVQSKVVYDDDEIKLFWEATRNLMPSCFRFIHKMHYQFPAANRRVINKLVQIVNIISKLTVLEPPSGADLFPKNIYPWIRRQNDITPYWSIHNAVCDTVHKGALEWIAHIEMQTNSSFRNVTLSRNYSVALQHLIEHIQLVSVDIQRSSEVFDRIFQEIPNFQYTCVLFLAYDSELAEIVKPIVEEVFETIMPLDYNVELAKHSKDTEHVVKGMKLFKLYLVLQRFINLGKVLSPNSINLKLHDYYSWFSSGLEKWLDISSFMACVRIQKAVEMDNFVPVDESVKFSSSAVDTLDIFGQILTFWQNLAWPDTKHSIDLFVKVVGIIRTCCNFYAQRLEENLDDMENYVVVDHMRYSVPQLWCLGISNIQRIRDSLPKVLQTFQPKNLVRGELVQNEDYGNQYEEIAKNIMESIIEIQENQIQNFIQNATQKIKNKMSTLVASFLTDSVDLANYSSNLIYNCVGNFLENQLQILPAESDDPNCQEMLNLIWNELCVIFDGFIQSNLDKRRLPLLYNRLEEIFEIMKASLFIRDDLCSGAILKLLKLHGTKTHNLIHQYYLQRHHEQTNLTEAPLGQLTINCNFTDDGLLITLLNARNLKTTNTDGLCNPYVRIHYLPQENFLSEATFKSTIQSKTIFPIYDQTFHLKLTPEQQGNGNGLILFDVKERSRFNIFNKYNAECFVRFSEIVENTIQHGSDKQIHMKLSKPQNLEYETIECLKFRQNDKLAKEFLKILKDKL